MDPDFHKLLVCPVCREPLSWRPAESQLACRKCRRGYAVRDGIPNMLPEEAATLPPALPPE